MLGCAGERTHVVALLALFATAAAKAQAKNKLVFVCNQCERGRDVRLAWAGPLHDTHMHTLESAVYNRFVECGGADMSRPTLYFIPYPATDVYIKKRGGDCRPTICRSKRASKRSSSERPRGAGAAHAITCLSFPVTSSHHAERRDHAPSGPNVYAALK